MPATATRPAVTIQQQPNKTQHYFWRKSAGLTMLEVKSETGISPGLLSLHENGVIPLTEERQRLLERLLKAKLIERRRAISAILDVS